MRKLLFSLALTIIFLSIAVAPVLAVEIENPVNPAFADFPSAISTIGTWLRPIGVLALLVSIVWGGFKIETAFGNPEAVKAGWAIIRGGITGFALLVLTPTIIQLVGSILGARQLLT